MPIPGADMNIFEITMQATLAAAGGSTTPVSNVFHYKRISFAPDVSKTSLETAFQASVGAAVLAATSSGYTQTATLVRCLDDSEDYAASFTEAGVGAIATDRLPSSAIVTCILRTGVRGRSYMGRKHFSGVPEAHTTGDVLTGGGLTLWQAVRDALAASITDGDGNIYIPVVFSRSLSPSINNPTSLVVTNVSSVLLNKNVSTYKRRKQKTVR